MAKKLTKRQQAWRKPSFSRNDLIQLKWRVYPVSKEAGRMVQALLNTRKLGASGTVAQRRQSPRVKF